ncbi:MAG: sn-glycerol-3-phosphate ABC transporter ATP-binding protein UgpC [bacterium]|uniref:Carbohydrate ABC transporter ATP-binding protein, CUT1 family n=2 Tax=Bacteria candidate phyla TaxID=1783234 RepID=A0A117M6C2_UNCT6|nr:MAG: Carbohydrate ABC transporter ATP-binding protein, CUT1 family [candidate division TA06 bacterium 32_111]KUK86769.1 MAG: Carbohydrate ABC transporter ATP-binding protein, CUT1 family [candidate division TA06 bacterium 34_109]MDI6700261.1 sn-glycerol-3-phosphate ABC transporter ATP-binding protein UgpC [bacterium]HAF08305.1 sugar ABC transporter ATP-binding protein [candidate division WOR-3 bacterium]HCP16559.1 sugar ABC transporter ATP-binding protein [candidate division WOR-3 bacterium]
MADVILKNVTKVFANGFVALKNINLEIEDKEFVVFVGPSGCGKTTLLRCIAGLEQVTEGEIIIDRQVVNFTHPKDRDVAMVFQNYALYPHMSVYDNVAFGLRTRGFLKEEIDRRVKDALEILGIEKYAKSKPRELSGGQRQRVAIGRAIVREPKVFLFDEPLSNLDAKMRVSMRAEISKLHKKLNTTIIYVTHDQTEAMTMGSKIVVMNNGQIMQIADPDTLYNKPENLFCATFIGSPQMNIFENVYENGKIKSDFFNFQVNFNEKELKGVYIGVRPEDIYIDRETDTYIDGVVELAESLGDVTFLYINIFGKNVVLKTTLHKRFQIGETYKVFFNRNKFHYFNMEDSKRIEPII